MKTNRSLQRNLLLVAIVFFLLACDPVSERHERIIWYVATTGSDSNVCTEVSDPCRTLAEAIGRADEDDKIIMAAGTYREVLVGEDGGDLSIDFSLWVSGEGMGETILDLNGGGGLLLYGDGSKADNFTIQNGGPTWCIEIGGTASSIDHVHALNCETGMRASGLNHMLNHVISSDNRSAGLAIVGSEDISIEGSEFNRNEQYGIDLAHSTISIYAVDASSNGSSGINIAGGMVTIDETSITNNGSPGGPIDPAIRVDGNSSVSISDSLIDSNRQGVGVFNSSSLVIEVSTISNQALEGVLVWGDRAQAQLHNVTVRNNCSEAVYCAIRNIDGTIAIRNSWISRNPTGGIFNDGGEISIDRTTIDENGGSVPIIYNQGSMVIQNSLIANNTSPQAIRNDAEMSILNSTISGNVEIGIMAHRGELALSYVTIAENGTDGLAVYATEAVRQITNVLIVKNGFDCSEAPISEFIVSGTNYNSDDSCPSSFITSSPAEILLDSLADNGGITLTHALLPGSPAIDGATSICPAGDQRLVARPIGAACDVGAYEAGVFGTSLEGTPLPTADTDTLIVEEDFPCYTGPGPQYTTLSTLAKGTELQIVGYGFGGGWLVAFHPNLPERHCWVDEDFVSFDVPVAELRLIIVPPKPTATATPPQEEREPTEVCVTPINQPNFCD